MLIVFWLCGWFCFSWCVWLWFWLFVWVFWDVGWFVMVLFYFFVNCLYYLFVCLLGVGVVLCWFVCIWFCMWVIWFDVLLKLVVDMIGKWCYCSVWCVWVSCVDCREWYLFMLVIFCNDMLINFVWFGFDWCECGLWLGFGVNVFVWRMCGCVML